MKTNEVPDHTFFEVLKYNDRVLLNSSAGGHALSIKSEEFFDLLENVSEGNQGYNEEMSRSQPKRMLGSYI